MQLLETLLAAVFEMRRPPSDAFAEAAVHVASVAATCTDEDVHGALAALSDLSATNGPTDDTHRGVQLALHAKKKVLAAAAHLRLVHRSGFKAPATFEAIDQVRYCRSAWADCNVFCNELAAAAQNCNAVNWYLDSAESHAVQWCLASAERPCGCVCLVVW